MANLPEANSGGMEIQGGATLGPKPPSRCPRCARTPKAGAPLTELSAGELLDGFPNSVGPLQKVVGEFAQSPGKLLYW